mgnify:FL=1
MLYTIPDYYFNFQCVGKSCPSTCCGGWQISIDPSSLRKYRKMKEPLRSRLENEIDWKHACFRQYEGRCAFLNEENLCDLYLEGGGEKAFCKACRIFPRHVEEFPGVRELSLSLSCPIAARMLLLQEHPTRFLRIKKDRQEKPFRNFDFSLFLPIMQTRTVLIRILQNRQKPFRLRAAVSLALAHDLQLRIDRRTFSQIKPLLHRYSSAKVWEWFENRLRTLDFSAEHQTFMYRRLLSVFDHLRVLREDWEPYLCQARKILHTSGIPAPQTHAAFYEIFTEQIAEQLLLYFVFIYFGGSAYHGNAFGEMKFSFVCAILIRELSRAQWLLNPDNMTKDSIIEAACRFSREIEHSDHNKEKMDQMLNDQTVWNLENLLLFLWKEET